MQILISFLLCFFPILYILRKLKQNRFLRKGLHNRGVFLSVTAILSILTAFFRTYLMGYVVYAIICYLIFDFLCFILKHLNRKIYHTFRKITGNGIVIFILAIVVTALSSVHVKKIHVVNYDIKLEKVLPKDIRLMLITDMHLGTTTNEATFHHISTCAMEQNPDYIVLGGDIFDESTSDDLLEIAYQKFSQLANQYKIYYVLGNHEYARGEIETLVERMEQIGVHVLMDEIEFVDQCFYLVGRMDRNNSFISKKERSSLKELMGLVNFNYPVILVDHQPVELEKAKELGVDLVLSGHTHAGQFFPMSIFASFLNERLYGLSKEQSFYTIVSSGIGVWGMAMRNASNSEIVIIDLSSQ